MHVFSKVNNSNMWIGEDLFPYGFSGFAGAIILCFISLYFFKRFRVDSNVPVRDSSKTHSWIPIKITSKVGMILNVLFVNNVRNF